MEEKVFTMQDWLNSNRHYWVALGGFPGSNIWGFKVPGPPEELGNMTQKERDKVAVILSHVPKLYQAAKKVTEDWQDDPSCVEKLIATVDEINRIIEL